METCIICNGLGCDACGIQPVVALPPTRKYSKGPKRACCFRMPDVLLKRLEKIAKDRGWSTTTIVVTALDQYAQFMDKQTL